MAEAATKLPVKTEKDGKTAAVRARHESEPLHRLRQEVDHLFDNFLTGFPRSMFDVEPFWRREPAWDTLPAVDLIDKDKSFQITAELPGMTENDVEVRLANGVLTIQGEKKEEKEEKKKDYYLSERRYGSFQRSFQVPESVDVDKIDATFKSGVLAVTLPKKADAVAKPAKKIPVSAK
jgi:HSP20 family protein